MPTTEKELLVVVFAIDKFHSYLVRAKIIIYIYHTAIRYLLNKKDAIPRLHRWILLLQEFNLEIRDKKGTKNVVTNHLSILEYLKLDHIPINDDFTYDWLIAYVNNRTNSDELELNVEIALIVTSVPWYVDFVNYLVANVLPHDVTYQQRKKILHDVKHFYWDDPLISKRREDDIYRCCVLVKEVKNIIT